jgi:hypothetical protein
VTLSPLLRSRWTLPAVLVVAALVLSGKLDAGRRAAERARAAEAEIARLAEAGRLDAQGLLVAERVKRAELEAGAAELLERHADLAAEVERLKRAAPGARPVATVNLRTGPVAVSPGSGSQEGAAAAQRHDPTAADSAGAPACVLHAGDQGEVRVAGVVYETKAGNRVPILALEAWRLNPDALLFGGVARGAWAEREPDPPAREAGWGGGVMAIGTGSGWAAGPLIAAPPLRLWRLQLEAAGGAAAGPSGTWAAVATAVARWR